jgi:hypothetical protein
METATVVMEYSVSQDGLAWTIHQDAVRSLAGHEVATYLDMSGLRVLRIPAAHDGPSVRSWVEVIHARVEEVTTLFMRSVPSISHEDMPSAWICLDTLLPCSS